MKNRHVVCHSRVRGLPVMEESSEQEQEFSMNALEKSNGSSTHNDMVATEAVIAATEAVIIETRATRGTILLVEDDRSILRYLEVTLQRAGYKVVTASDGLEAMKAAMAGTIDAVVTDAIMPHLSGYELCRFLRRHPKFQQLPVILLSGLERADSSHEAADRADIYLAKPVRPEELTDCLARLLLKTT